jgi:hypothetical protein
VRTWGIALLAAGATAAALGAQVVPATARSGAPATYDISLTGSQRSVVTKSAATTDDSGCTVRHADRDVRTVSFASRRRASLAISGRGLPRLRFDLLARVSGSFHRETSSVGGCGPPPTESDRSCGPALVRTRLTIRPRPRLGVRLVGGFARASDQARCATTLVSPDGFIQSSESRLTRSPAGAARIVVRGRLVQNTKVNKVTQITTVRWRLVLTRV